MPIYLKLVNSVYRYTDINEHLPDPEPEVVSSIISFIVAVIIGWRVSQNESSGAKRDLDSRFMVFGDLLAHQQLIATQTLSTKNPIIQGRTCHAVAVGLDSLFTHAHIIRRILEDFLNKKKISNLSRFLALVVIIANVTPGLPNTL